jgi:hypothetical protein
MYHVGSPPRIQKVEHIRQLPEIHVSTDRTYVLRAVDPHTNVKQNQAQINSQSEKILPSHVLGDKKENSSPPLSPADTRESVVPVQNATFASPLTNTSSEVAQADVRTRIRPEHPQRVLSTNLHKENHSIAADAKNTKSFARATAAVHTIPSGQLVASMQNRTQISTMSTKAVADDSAEAILKGSAKIALPVAAVVALSMFAKRYIRGGSSNNDEGEHGRDMIAPKRGFHVMPFRRDHVDVGSDSSFSETSATEGSSPVLTRHSSIATSSYSDLNEAKQRFVPTQQLQEQKHDSPEDVTLSSQSSFSTELERSGDEAESSSMDSDCGSDSPSSSSVQSYVPPPILEQDSSEPQNEDKHRDISESSSAPEPPSESPAHNYVFPLVIERKPSQSEEEDKHTEEVQDTMSDDDDELSHSTSEDSVEDIEADASTTSTQDADLFLPSDVNITPDAHTSPSASSPRSGDSAQSGVSSPSQEPFDASGDYFGNLGTNGLTNEPLPFASNMQQDLEFVAAADQEGIKPEAELPSVSDPVQRTVSVHEHNALPESAYLQLVPVSHSTSLILEENQDNRPTSLMNEGSAKVANLSASERDTESEYSEDTELESKRGPVLTVEQPFVVQPLLDAKSTSVVSDVIQNTESKSPISEKASFPTDEREENYKSLVTDLVYDIEQDPMPIPEQLKPEPDTQARSISDVEQETKSTSSIDVKQDPKSTPSIGEGKSTVDQITSASHLEQTPQADETKESEQDSKQGIVLSHEQSSEVGKSRAPVMIRRPTEQMSSPYEAMDHMGRRSITRRLSSFFPEPHDPTRLLNTR